jgi:hypothetical protein
MNRIYKISYETQTNNEPEWMGDNRKVHSGDGDAQTAIDQLRKGELAMEWDAEDDDGKPTGEKRRTTGFRLIGCELIAEADE